MIVLVSLLLVAAADDAGPGGAGGARRFPQLQRKNGAACVARLVWSLGSTVLALLSALVISMPLWLVPPLILMLPPLIWGWLTYRVMAFDALAEHASAKSGARSSGATAAACWASAW